MGPIYFENIQGGLLEPLGHTVSIEFYKAIPAFYKSTL